MIFSLLRISFFLFLLLSFNASYVSSAVGSGNNSHQHTLTAKEIMGRMAQVYASCKTYRDTGVVSRIFSLFGIAIDRWTDTMPFSTAFLRPNHFRFEFKSRFDRTQNNWHRYIIHNDPTGVRTWWDIDSGIEYEESLSLAIAGATGVSGGSAHTIPVMLLPEVVGVWRLTDLKNPSTLKDGIIDDHECWRIYGKNRLGNPMTLWVDKKTSLVRRIETRYRIYFLLRTDKTTNYRPEVDVEIDPQELRFNPPEM